MQEFSSFIERLGLPLALLVVVVVFLARLTRFVVEHALVPWVKAQIENGERLARDQATIAKFAETLLADWEKLRSDLKGLCHYPRGGKTDANSQA